MVRAVALTSPSAGARAPRPRRYRRANAWEFSIYESSSLNGQRCRQTMVGYRIGPAEFSTLAVKRKVVLAADGVGVANGSRELAGDLARCHQAVG